MAVRTGSAVRVGVTALVVGAVGVPGAYAVQGAAPAGTVAAATVQLDINASKGACSGALLSPWWVVTATSCFAETQDKPVVQGRPANITTATIGRIDLNGTAGHTVGVDRLVPHPTRDVVLVRLATPVTDVVPVQVATTAPAVTDQLTVTGYGRTANALVPDTTHATTYRVTSVGAGTLDIEATTTGATICKGDAGGPALRTTPTGIELVAIHHTAYQGGCFGSTTTLQGATETRLDNLRDWFARSMVDCAPTAVLAPASAPVGDGQLIRTADGVISIVAGGAKYALSPAQWAAMGSPGYVSVSDATAATLVQIPRSGTLLRNLTDGVIYEIVSGARYRLSQAEWQALGMPGYVNVPQEFIDRAADAVPSGPVLLREPGTGLIHQVVGCSRYLLSLQEWLALGSPAYVSAPGALIARIPVGVPTRPTLLRDRTDGGIYQIAGGARYRLSMAEWLALGTPAYTDVPPGLLAQVTRTIPDEPVLLRDRATLEIYGVMGGTKKKLSQEDWLALTDRSYVEVPAAWIALIPNR